MIFSKKEINRIKKIPPTQYEKYLESKNWVKMGIIDKNTASVWKLEEKRIFVPLDSSLRDYSNRLIGILLALEEIENRELDSIIFDIKYAGLIVLKEECIANTFDSFNENVGLLDMNKKNKGTMIVTKAKMNKVVKKIKKHSTKTDN